MSSTPRSSGRVRTAPVRFSPSTAASSTSTSSTRVKKPKPRPSKKKTVRPNRKHARKGLVPVALSSTSISLAAAAAGAGASSSSAPSASPERLDEPPLSPLVVPASDSAEGATGRGRLSSSNPHAFEMVVSSSQEARDAVEQWDQATPVERGSSEDGESANMLVENDRAATRLFLSLFPTLPSSDPTSSSLPSTDINNNKAHLAPALASPPEPFTQEQQLSKLLEITHQVGALQSVARRAERAVANLEASMTELESPVENGPPSYEELFKRCQALKDILTARALAAGGGGSSSSSSSRSRNAEARPSTAKRVKVA